MYSRDCVDDICVSGATSNYTRLLMSPEHADTVKEDIQFVVHFLGDVHQPLHCARLNDKGGNLISPVYYNTNEGGVWDLHQIWDFGIIENHVSDVSEGGDRLLEEVKEGGRWADDVDVWLECSEGFDVVRTSEWGQESLDYALAYAYVNEAGEEFKNGMDVSEMYAEERWEVVKVRLLQGGARLPRILDDIAVK